MFGKPLATLVSLGSVVLMLGAPAIGQNLEDDSASLIANSATAPRPAVADGPWGMWWGILDEQAAILDLRPGRFALHDATRSATEPGEQRFSGALNRTDRGWTMSPAAHADLPPLPSFAVAEYDESNLILLADNGSSVTFSRTGKIEDVPTRFHRFTGAWQRKGQWRERLVLSPGRFELKVREARRSRWSVKSFGTWQVDEGKLRLRYVADLQTPSVQLTGYSKDWDLVFLADERFILQDDAGNELVYLRSSDPTARK